MNIYSIKETLIFIWLFYILFFKTDNEIDDVPNTRPEDRDASSRMEGELHMFRTLEVLISDHHLPSCHPIG